MPLYEYKCRKCGLTFEIIQKLKDEPAKKCIQCGGPLNKVLSPSALQFKGNGWYVTDYPKNKKPEKKEGKEKEKPTTKEEKPEKSSE